MEIPSQCVQRSCFLSVYVAHWVALGYVFSSSENTAVKQGVPIITRHCSVCGADTRMGGAAAARVAYAERGGTVMFTPTT